VRSDRLDTATEDLLGFGGAVEGGGRYTGVLEGTEKRRGAWALDNMAQNAKKKTKHQGVGQRGQNPSRLKPI